MFTFLFWPGGCVGRAAWWWTQISIFLFIVLALVFYGVTVARDINAGKPATTFASAGASQQIAMLRAALLDLQSRLERGDPVMWLPIILALVAEWVGIANEIKRWHDNGMTGAWILLRVLPSLVRGIGGAYFGLTVLVIVWLFQIYYLGFRAGGHRPISQPSRPNSSARSFLPPPAPPTPGASRTISTPSVPRKEGGLLRNFGMALVVLVLIAGAGVGGFMLRGSVPSKSASDSVDGAFGKDWVVINGEKLTGISSVVVTSHNDISLVGSTGMKVFPKSSLPAGFLSGWNIATDK
jgi:uncharacterized membrane protein YhaH (DUF805 family)